MCVCCKPSYLMQLERDCKGGERTWENMFKMIKNLQEKKCRRHRWPAVGYGFSIKTDFSFSTGWHCFTFSFILRRAGHSWVWFTARHGVDGTEKQDLIYMCLFAFCDTSDASESKLRRPVFRSRSCLSEKSKVLVVWHFMTMLSRRMSYIHLSTGPTARVFSDSPWISSSAKISAGYRLISSCVSIVTSTKEVVFFCRLLSVCLAKNNSKSYVSNTFLLWHIFQRRVNYSLV